MDAEIRVAKMIVSCGTGDLEVVYNWCTVRSVQCTLVIVWCTMQLLHIETIKQSITTLYIQI